MDRISFYIGVPKTANSTFQKNFLVTNRNALGVGPGIKEGPGAELLALYKDFYFGICKAEASDLDRFCRGFVQAVTDRPGNVIVSDQNFTVGYTDYFPIQSVVAERIARYFPSANIVLMLRSQVEAIESFVHQALNPLRLGPYPRTSINVDLQQFLDANCNERATGYCRSLQYDKIIDAYQDHFTKGQICVLPYELLKADPARFIATFAAALGTDEQSLHAAYFVKSKRNATLNTRQKAWQSLRKRIPTQNLRARLGLLRPLQGVVDNWMAGGTSRKAEMSLEQAERVNGFFRESNRRTEQLTGLDLGKLGYPV